MNSVRQWWSNDLPPPVKFVFVVLLLNALPAIFFLMVFSDRTENLFVWTVKPAINARLLGVMYANALIMIGIGAIQTSWARVRVVMVVITLFSVLATLLTFVYLKPFLAHPWFHLAYWLTMYLVLFVAAPYVFVTQERRSGGRLPPVVPMTTITRAILSVFALVSLVAGVGLLFQIDLLNQIWPWTLPPLVGGLIGVLFVAHAAAYAWAVQDGGWLRSRPIVWQAPVTAMLFLLLPLLHPADLRPDAGAALAAYAAVAGAFALSSLAIIASYRSAEQAERAGA